MAEFLDPNFTPDIFELVDYQDELALKRWKFNANAVPVPSPERKSVGLWFGRY